MCSEAIADSVWVRWSKTRTRSVSMNAAVGTPTGSRSGSGTRRLEAADRVVGEGADGAAGEARHALGRLDAAARDERADGARADRAPRPSRSAGPGRRSATVTGRVWMRAWPSRTSSSRRGPDAQERVAAEALAALDRLEQVGRDRRRRGAGRRRSGSRGRPGAWRAAGSCRRWRRGAWSAPG